MELKALPSHRRLEERIVRGLLLAASSFSVLILAWLLVRTGQVAEPWVDWQFLTSYPSILSAERSGIMPAVAGSAWLAVLTMALALPTGVLAGVYLNEYAKNTRLTRFLRLTIANLAGVPSVVFGILGLAIFVRGFTLGGVTFFGYGYVLLAGALTLAAMVLPIVIVATEEALKAVPTSMREAAYGLGATKWQVTRDHVLPYASPGILTGSILALARAVGESAPLILVGGASVIYFLPDGPTSLYTALPLQTFVWAEDARADFQSLAAAGTVVLLAFILLANLTAIVLRNRFQKKYRW
ncbi:MAG TPA: phosphate ABC transporter permease PstA [Candidatus Thermoplasmatota archaeon]|nr:phosphate ABC transporter permease PstA [Candidatus Thermoplasmatota archaeon]